MQTQNNSQLYNDYDEISLRELIEILIKQKATIAGVTIVSLLIAFVVSFFIMDPIYEAKTVLMASQIIDKINTTKQGDGVEGLLSTISEYPQLTIETYKEQIKNPIILQETIDELKLDAMGITRNDLKDMIELETIDNTNLIAIKVQHSNKVLATDIANTVSREFSEFISNMVKQQAAKSSNYISQQLDIEKQKLDEVLMEYKEFLSQPKGVKELEQEINSKIQLLTSYKTDLSVEKITEQNLRAKIKQTEEELKNVSPTVELKKSLSDDVLISDVVNNGQESSNITLITEEKNQYYYALRESLSDYKIALSENLAKQANLTKEIENTQRELEVLHTELADKKHQENIITRKINIAQSTYDAFTKKLEESRIAQSSVVGDSSIIVLSPAVEPLKPTSPKKMLNLAIAGVLGLMLGVLVAFFREYWKNTSRDKKIASS